MYEKLTCRSLAMCILRSLTLGSLPSPFPPPPEDLLSSPPPPEFDDDELPLSVPSPTGFFVRLPLKNSSCVGALLMNILRLSGFLGGLIMVDMDLSRLCSASCVRSGGVMTNGPARDERGLHRRPERTREVSVGSFG